jgi:translation initiation factor RLI1
MIEDNDLFDNKLNKYLRRDQIENLLTKTEMIWNIKRVDNVFKNDLQTHRTPTSSVVDDSTIYGRDCDRKKLKDFLLSENGSDCGKEIGVISIVGMGGIGKTTLEKLLYNDSKLLYK